MKIFSVLAFMLFFLFLNYNTATAQAETDFVDMMRQGGKIYVVCLLLGVILSGVLIYLVILERKLAKLEKQLPGK